MRLTVIGCGYLGAVHAAAMAELGHHVLGIETDPARLEPLAQGESPFYEPGLDELLRRGARTGRLRYTAALYYTRLHNMQVQQMGAPGQVFITNAASATSRGAELEAEWLPARSWLVQAGVALNRTHFGHFSDGANRYDGHHNPMTPATPAPTP